jgi:hypothetical protein
VTTLCTLANLISARHAGVVNVHDADMAIIDDLHLHVIDHIQTVLMLQNLPELLHRYLSRLHPSLPFTKAY